MKKASMKMSFSVAFKVTSMQGRNCLEEAVRYQSKRGIALTREDLKGRALRLTREELDHIVSGGDWLE